MQQIDQKLLSGADMSKLGIEPCPRCGGGGSGLMGELCLYREKDGDLVRHSVWCRDCERGASGATLAQAIARWTRRVNLFRHFELGEFGPRHPPPVKHFTAT